VDEVLVPILDDPFAGRTLPEKDHVVRLVSATSKKCIVVDNMSQDDGAKVIQWTCESLLPHETFKLVDDGDGWFHIKAMHSGKCLDVKNAGTGNRVSLQQWHCANVDNQKFRFEKIEPDGGYRIRAKHSNRCVDQTGSMDNGGPVQQYNCVRHQNLTWYLYDVENRFVRIRSRKSGKLLDVSGAGTANGANIQQWDDANGLNQLFILAHVKDESSNEYYKIIDAHSGKCLDVSKASISNGGNIQLWDCGDVDNQKFDLMTNSRYKGYYLIKALHSGKCLDLSGGQNNNGANIQQWDCNFDNLNQQWEIVHNY
jgi:hypothetical protein